MSDAYRYFTAFSIPVVLILISALTKKIVRKTGFEWEHFFLGVDLTLAAFAAAAVNVADLLEIDPKSIPQPNIGVTATIYIISCFLLFVLQVAFHQDWSDRPGSTQWKQILVLGIASNAVGAALLGFFVLLKMKGKI
ncbi:MAG: hypothetical protein LAO19_20055 [Acidobacteriia bacterium]|nr:hypothetical protein [Terriglobia bacterium]